MIEVWIRDKNGRAIANYVPGRIGRKEGSFLYARQRLADARDRREIDRKEYLTAVGELKAYRELSLLKRTDYEPKLNMVMGELEGALRADGDSEHPEIPEEMLKELGEAFDSIIGLSEETSKIADSVAERMKRLSEAYRKAI